MRRVTVAAIAIILVAVAAAIVAIVLATRGESSSASAPADLYRGSEPPGVNRLPGFRLPSVEGKTVDSTLLGGKVVVVTFVDSACHESCPIIVGVLGQALPQLAPGERRQLAALALSVDPRVDSPAHVRRFLRQRHALGQLDYLVAPERTMRPVWTAFHVLPATDTGDADVHSAGVRVFDREGVWVSNLHAGVDLTAANLIHDIREALARSSSSSTSG